MGKRFFAALMAVMAFYFAGIVLNCTILRMFFEKDMTQVPVWSGYGFLALLIAGIAGILSVKIYKYFCTHD